MSSDPIRKWDVFLANLNPPHGTEPGKVRPVVVVQTDLLNGTHTSTIVCPLSSKIWPGSKILRVHLIPKEAGLSKRTDVLVDQVRAIDNRRFVKKLGRISSKSAEKLQENLLTLLS